MKANNVGYLLNQALEQRIDRINLYVYTYIYVLEESDKKMLSLGIRKYLEGFGA